MYKDTHITQVSVQMHEIGHNLGLHHAASWTGVEWDEYGDQSGFMGYAAEEDEGPVMCFNGPKSWQLGWYTGAYMYVDLRNNTGSTDEAWAGYVIGPTDYRTWNISDGPAYVVVKVETGMEWDFYVSFNAGKAENSGTMLGRNEVLIHVTNADGHLNADKSYLYAELKGNESFKLPEGLGAPYGSSVVISVAEIRLVYDVSYAQVVISTTKMNKADIYDDLDLADENSNNPQTEAYDYYAGKGWTTTTTAATTTTGKGYDYYY